MITIFDRSRRLRIIGATCMGLAVILALVSFSFGGPVPWHLLLGLVGGVVMVAASFVRGTSAERSLAILGVAGSLASIAALAWLVVHR